VIDRGVLGQGEHVDAFMPQEVDHE
jgi:hypothetical protein